MGAGAQIYGYFFWLFWAAVALLGLLVALWLWRGGDYLVVETPIAPADAIIVLGGRTERFAEGVRLYKQGYAPYLLFTGGGLPLRLARVHLVWGDIMREAALSEGIPPEAIVVDEHSTSTYEDAVNTKGILQARQWRSAIVISSIYHMHRVRMTFEKVYAGTGIRLHYRAAPGGAYQPRGWWRHEEDMVYVVTEYLKLVMYWLKY